MNSKKRKPEKKPEKKSEKWDHGKYRKLDILIQKSLISQVHNGGTGWKELNHPTSEINPRSLTTTSGQKWWVAVIVGFIFFILASPSLFKLTNKLLKTIYLPNSYSNGSTTLFGLFLHMLIFIIIIRFILW